ncbi:protein FAR1-RELATED SEQUENCE 5-like [Arachis stenosperma]|uniref:protein FAR1-RELATED SEQUENCE 5-like n=1 Tax=Arachis stenosperma TaxID=217475 RepID=UPI0025AC5B56|nr:protein FAR1-RELATED SEQUENCE 5-like [Arachis stenosperma]
MDQSICEEVSYDTAYDVSDHYNFTNVNVPSLSEDDTQHVDKGKEFVNVIQLEDDAMAVNHELLDHTGIPIEKISYVGLRFVFLQRAQEFYSNYAKKVDFVTRIRNTNFDKIRKESKIPINQSIHCSREGYRESWVKATTRVKRITTVGCKARMYTMLDRQKDNWMVSKLELKHTHPCSAKQAVHYTEYRELTMHAKCEIQNNDEAGIWPNKTYLALENEFSGSSNLGYLEKDMRNYITSNMRCADENADVKEMISYFMRMKDINPNFFYAVDMAEANKFKSAFWVDARCKTSYEYYGDVVSFDITYNRNMHRLLFASFVGVNHHGKSTLLGCALLAIIMDQCKSMFVAIRNVLPDIRHQWCIWHILKKIPHKFGGYAWYREIEARMHGTVWNARSMESFKKDWSAIILYCDLIFFFYSEFWAGMRSTQRSESMHAFFGGYLHCKSGLVQVVHEYDNVPGNKEQKELEDDYADFKGVFPCSSSSTIESQFQHEYTTYKFKEVQQEFRKRMDCLVRGVTQEGDLFRVTDFVTCKEEAAMLHSGLDELRTKLFDYRANLGSKRVPTTQNSMVTQRDPTLGASDIQCPSKVSTTGRPRLKRLGSELNTSIKKFMRRKKKNPPPLYV